MGLALLLGVFALCVVIGLPVAFALGIAALAAFFYEGLPLLIVFQRIVAACQIGRAGPVVIQRRALDPRQRPFNAADRHDDALLGHMDIC